MATHVAEHDIVLSQESSDAVIDREDSWIGGRLSITQRDTTLSRESSDAVK